MFKLATGDVLWKMQRKFPDTFGPAVRIQILKPLGHALIVDHALTSSPKTILEIGHGATSLSFDLLRDLCECWGLDAQDKDRTVSSESLDRLRIKYNNIKFVDGYMGLFSEALPSNYFDLVFSVSVVEHVPVGQYADFFADISRILKPGGVHMHSYDVFWRKDLRPMYSAVEQAGFQWIEPKEKMKVYWEDWLAPRNEKDPGVELNRVAFEHPYMVLEVFSHNIPTIERVLHNWVSVHMGAKKQ